MVAHFSCEEVLELTKKIPRGRVTTYGELAKAFGSIRFSRAVGVALKNNRKLVKVPCHRVVRSNGYVGGYSRGSEEKIRLLREEGILVESGKVCGFREKLITVSELLSH